MGKCDDIARQNSMPGSVSVFYILKDTDRFVQNVLYKVKPKQFMVWHWHLPS